MGVPPNGWFIMDNPIKMDDLGVSLFFGNTHLFFSQKHFILQISASRPKSGLWWLGWWTWHLTLEVLVAGGGEVSRSIRDVGVWSAHWGHGWRGVLRPDKEQYTKCIFMAIHICIYICVWLYIYIHLFIVMMTGLQFPHHAIPVGRCGWLNMYPFKSWSFLVTVTSFLEVPWVLIEILSMIFFSICRGEFITRKSYLSTSNSRLLDCGWKVEHVANVKINRKSLTRIGNNERSFPLKSFMKTTIQVNYSVFLIKEVWPTSSLGLTSTF